GAGKRGEGNRGWCSGSEERLAGPRPTPLRDPLRIGHQGFEDADRAPAPMSPTASRLAHVGTLATDAGKSWSPGYPRSASQALACRLLLPLELQAPDVAVQGSSGMAPVAWAERKRACAVHVTCRQGRAEVIAGTRMIRAIASCAKWEGSALRGVRAIC